MGDFKNTFSWSWSRKQTFDTCLRQYWYQYYGFWDGWSRDAPEETRELYVQKKPQSRAQCLGIQVHEALEWVLKSVRKGYFPTADQLVARTRSKVLRLIDDSKHSRYRVNAKKYPGFIDHYYPSEVEDPWEPLTDEVVRQVRGIFENPVFLRLARVPDRICEIEELEQITVGDVPVWVSLDVLVSDGAGGFVIVDWKTGRNHQATKVAAQLGVYSLYVSERYFEQSTAENPVIHAMYVNTRHNTFETFVVDSEVVRVAQRTISDSASEMKGLLENELENIADKERFHRIPEGSEACTRCVFRRSCGRE